MERRAVSRESERVSRSGGTMLKTTVDDVIRDHPKLFSDVDRANRFLKERFTGSEGLASVEWSLRTDGRGCPVLDLEFKDVDGETASDEFAPDELDSLNHFGARAYRLWGDLVRSRTQKSLMRLHEIVSGWEARDLAQD
jgi:hypothetical protein